MPFNDYIDKVFQLLTCKLEILGVIMLLCMSKAPVVIHKLSIDGDSKFVSKKFRSLPEKLLTSGTAWDGVGKRPSIYICFMPLANAYAPFYTDCTHFYAPLSSW